MFCSGAGFATRALVTARDQAGHSLMLVVPLNAGERVRPLEAPLQGMRAAVTGAVDFSGCSTDRTRAWEHPATICGSRTSRPAPGGVRLSRRADCAAWSTLRPRQLRTAGRLDNPHQKARLGSAMIACETSRLWVRQAARLAEDRNADPARAVAYTGLARIAVESACLDAMRLVQRSLGLARSAAATRSSGFAAILRRICANRRLMKF